MILEPGQFLYFYPPELPGEYKDVKKRYMLILNIDKERKILKLLNVSKLKGKEPKMLHDNNERILNYYPLPLPSFVKLNTLYKIKIEENIEDFVAFNGEKINQNELERIRLLRKNYIEKHKDSKSIIFLYDEILKYNNNILNI